jgi:small GTP-binding protein
MPANVTPQYQKAEQEYLEAETTEKKIIALKRMIALAPSHKGAENLRANLKRRLAKLKYTKEKEIKKKKGGKEGIRKTGDAQVSIVGMTNVGKSSLLSLLTNARPKIASYAFTTVKPEVGTLNYEGFKIQIIEIPPITGRLKNDKANLSIARESEITLVLATTKEQLAKTLEELKEARIKCKKIIVMNKIDLNFPLAINLPFIPISCKNKKNIEELKKKIIKESNLIRIYSKDPMKKPSEKPIILKKGSTVNEVCKKIRRDFKEKFSFAKIWGTSVKFPGQQVGLNHMLEDKDIVEIHLR